MGNETSIFEGPPMGPPPLHDKQRNSNKKKIKCDEETAVMEIVGSMKSTIVSRSAANSSRNAVNVSSAVHSSDCVCAIQCDLLPRYMHVS